MRTGQFLTAKLHDDTGSINLMWFKGVDYIKDSLKDGETIAVHGKINEYKGNFQIAHPEYDKLNDNEIALSTGFVIPVYPLTEELKKVGLTSRNMRKIIYQALNSLGNINDHFTKAQLDDFELCSLNEAMRNIHCPDNIEKLRLATCAK